MYTYRLLNSRYKCSRINNESFDSVHSTGRYRIEFMRSVLLLSLHHIGLH
jgi:hypothetical protein